MIFVLYRVSKVLRELTRKPLWLCIYPKCFTQLCGIKWSFILHIWLLENNSSTDSCRILFLFPLKCLLTHPLFCNSILTMLTHRSSCDGVFQPLPTPSLLLQFLIIQKYHIFLPKIWNLFDILVLIAFLPLLTAEVSILRWNSKPFSYLIQFTFSSFLPWSCQMCFIL